jgi:hypothetical protein
MLSFAAKCLVRYHMGNTHDNWGFDVCANDLARSKLAYLCARSMIKNCNINEFRRRPYHVSCFPVVDSTSMLCPSLLEFSASFFKYAIQVHCTSAFEAAACALEAAEQSKYHHNASEIYVCALWQYATTCKRIHAKLKYVENVSQTTIKHLILSAKSVLDQMTYKKDEDDMQTLSEGLGMILMALGRFVWIQDISNQDISNTLSSVGKYLVAQMSISNRMEAAALSESLQLPNGYGDEMKILETLCRQSLKFHQLSSLAQHQGSNFELCAIVSARAAVLVHENNRLKKNIQEMGKLGGKIVLIRKYIACRQADMIRIMHSRSMQEENIREILCNADDADPVRKQSYAMDDVTIARFIDDSMKQHETSMLSLTISHDIVGYLTKLVEIMETCGSRLHEEQSLSRDCFEIALHIATADQNVVEMVYHDRIDELEAFMKKEKFKEIKKKFKEIKKKQTESLKPPGKRR